MNDREKIIRYKKHIKDYLSELRELSRENPLESQLLSLEETEKIRGDSMEALKGKPVLKINLGFEDKKTPRFKNYVTKLHFANPNPVYVWIDKANSCGLYTLSSLLSFNFGFTFDVVKEGIVVLLANNLSDLLIFDFSHDKDQIESQMDIEACGSSWGVIDY